MSLRLASLQAICPKRATRATWTTLHDQPSSTSRLKPTLPRSKTLLKPKQQQQQQEVLPPIKETPSPSPSNSVDPTPASIYSSTSSTTTTTTTTSGRVIPIPHQRNQRRTYETIDRHGQPRQHQQRQQHNQQQHREGGGVGIGHWLHHFNESKRGAVRAFTFGTAITLATYSTYNYFVTTAPSLESAQASFLNSATSAAASPTESAFRSFSPFSGAPRFEKQLKMLSQEQVDERLAQNEKSFRVLTDGMERKNKPKQDLIVGYSINQVASNNPIEDDLSRHVVRGQDGSIDKVFFGVFDGHGGWCCSQKVALELAPTVATELENVKDPHDIVAVMEAIENGFLKLDDRIVNETVKKVLEFPSRPLACSSLLPAISGSCALMAYIDVKEKDLFVACTGDSRAVLGVREKSPTKKDGHIWKAVPMSFDQTGRNRWEVRRMQEEHPGEENTVIMRGRVLGGLEPTRAFGDARYKWTVDIQERVFKLFPSYRQPHRNYHTPPYVTSKPVVKHHKIKPEDRFLVMATDGLWDKLTSDEVIQLVGDLLDGKQGQEKLVLDRQEIKTIADKVQSIKAAVTGKKGDQVQEEPELTPTNLPPKGPVSQIRQFTFKDKSNASTHLVRNALGGGDDERLAATLSIPAPMSRVYRDDITVTVIFFGSDSDIDLSNAQNNDGFVEIV
ncbi:hypothetical protein BGZ76_003023 [Entomortierella beljakovae]|nr:hypothetical protein BGZ76_003023 [Entomortierella beljakovae]